LPVYDGIGRLKQQAHWQTDVLAGWALGTGVGYWSAHRDTPLSVEILPRGSVSVCRRDFDFLAAIVLAYLILSSQQLAEASVGADASKPRSIAAQRSRLA